VTVSITDEVGTPLVSEEVPVVVDDNKESLPEKKKKKPRAPTPPSSDSESSSSSSSSSSASDTDKRKKRKRKKNKQRHAKTQQPATDMVAMLTAALQNGKLAVNLVGIK
jgi:hypothetical protein